MSFDKYIVEYQKQLAKGEIQKVYKGLMKYIRTLKNHFVHKYPNGFVASSIHQGFMDVTYFSFTPESLKNKKLKVSVVFLHEKMQFGVFLAGQNKEIQERYWAMFKSSDWDKYTLPDRGQYSIVEFVIVEKPDFSDLPALTREIETKVMKFTKDVEKIIC